MQQKGKYDEIPEYHSVQKIMQRTRSKILPPIPRTIQDVTIQNEWAQTISGKPFLRLLNNVTGTAVFASKRCLKELVSCDTIFIDGTFRSCPKPYTQLVVVCGIRHGRMLPLAYGLSTGKEAGKPFFLYVGK